MRQENLQAEELAALLGHQAPITEVGDCSQPPSRTTPRIDDEEDPWSTVGHGEGLDELPFTADVRFTLLSICEEFADRLQLRLAEVLRVAVGVQCDKIIADTFAAFVLSMPQPTCFAVAGMAPIDAKLLIELPCATSFPVLEQLLGGQASHDCIPRRPLTDFELRIIGHVLDTMLSMWSSAWQSVAPFHTVLERIESNPRVVRCLSAAEPILVASFAIVVAERPMAFRVAMPIKSAVNACNCRQATPVDDQPRYRGTTISRKKE